MKQVLHIKHRFRWLAAIVIGIAVIGYFLWPKAMPHAPKNFPIAVKWEAVKARQVPVVIDAIGSIKAAHSEAVTGEVAGRIKAIVVQAGAHVAKGAELFRFEDTAEVAQVTQVETEARRAQLAYERAKALLSKQGIAQKDYDSAQLDWQQQQAAVVEAKARWAKKQVRAPFAGIVGEIRVHVGEHVSAGTELTRLVDPHQLVVHFDLPQVNWAALRVGQKVAVSMPQQKTKPISAVVSYIAPEVDKTARTVAVEATLPQRAELLPGAFVAVRQHISVDNDALVIPEKSLMAGIDGFSVFKHVKGHAKRVMVTLGTRSQGWVQVKQGLALGDEVVTEGQQKLRDGAAIVAVQPVTDADTLQSAAPRSP